MSGDPPATEVVESCAPIGAADEKEPQQVLEGAEGVSGSCDAPPEFQPPKPGQIGSCCVEGCNGHDVESIIILRKKYDAEGFFNEEAMEHEFPTLFDPKVKFTYKNDGVLLTALLCGHGNLMAVANVSEKHRISEDFMFLRFRLSKAPKFVFSNDAGALEAFCLQHEAKHFADTLFLHLPGEAATERPSAEDRKQHRLNIVSLPPSTLPSEVQWGPTTKDPLQIGWTGTVTSSNTLDIVFAGMMKELKGNKIPLVPWMQVVQRDLTRRNMVHYQLVNQYLTQQKEKRKTDTQQKESESKVAETKEDEKKQPSWEEDLGIAVKMTEDQLTTACEDYMKTRDRKWLRPLRIVLGVTKDSPGQVPKSYLAKNGKFNNCYGVEGLIAAFNQGILPHLIDDLKNALQRHDFERAYLVLGTVAAFGMYNAFTFVTSLFRLRATTLVTFALNSPDPHLKALATEVRDYWKESKAWRDPRCQNKTCDKETGNVKLCSRCRVALYCSAECQKKCWKAHKPYCKSPPAAT